MQLFEYIDVLNTPYHIYLQSIPKTDFFIKPHWHYYIEILILTQGRAVVTCGDSTFTLIPGSLLFIGSQCVHSVRADDDQPTHYIVMKFDSNTLKIPHAYLSRFRDIFSHIQQAGACLFTQEDLADYPIRSLAESCIRELKIRHFAYDFNVQSNLSMILVYLARIMEHRKFCIPQMQKKEGNTFFSHILEYIDTHSHEPLQVQELAVKSNMSYSNFARLFKGQYGRSCKSYIEYVRICKAEELVLHSNLDLSYIAQETGFADCSHLIRTYKKLKGTTPKQARLNTAKSL